MLAVVSSSSSRRSLLSAASSLVLFSSSSSSNSFRPAQKYRPAASASLPCASSHYHQQQRCHLKLSLAVGTRSVSTSTLQNNSRPQPGYIGVSSPPTSSLANELNLRCTVLTPSGITSVSGAFRKMDLCLEHGLEPRDLRKVDSRIPNLVPTILARKQAFLVNILHIRALIKSDTVFLFDSYGSSDTTLHSAFVYNLEHNLRAPTSSNKLPFEFRALETALSSALDALRSELYLTSDMVHHLLESLDSHINRENLGMLLQYSRKVNAFLRRAQGVKTAASEVLESDADMALMYLTDAQAGHPRDPNTSSVEELELLLESFEKQVEEVVSEAESMSSNIQNTQEVVELILDSNRNDLLNLDLRTSLTTLAVSSGTLVSGLFGMNLLSHLEENAYAFYGVSSVVGCITAGVMVAGWRLLARMRRVGLQQGSGMGAGTPWASYSQHAPIGGGSGHPYGHGSAAVAAWHLYGGGAPGGGGATGSVPPAAVSPAALGSAGMGPSPATAAAGAAQSGDVAGKNGSAPPYRGHHAYGAAAPWRHHASYNPYSHATRSGRSSRSDPSSSSSSSSSSSTAGGSMMNRVSHALWRLSGGKWREKRRGLREKLAQAQAARLAQAQAQAHAAAAAAAEAQVQQAQARARATARAEAEAEAQAEVDLMEAAKARAGSGGEGVPVGGGGVDASPTSAPPPPPRTTPPFFEQNDESLATAAKKNSSGSGGGGRSLRMELEREAAAWLAERHAEEAKWRERTYVREPVGAFGAWGRGDEVEVEEERSRVDVTPAAGAQAQQPQVQSLSEEQVGSAGAGSPDAFSAEAGGPDHAPAPAPAPTPLRAAGHGTGAGGSAGGTSPGAAGSISGLGRKWDSSAFPSLSKRSGRKGSSSSS
ncbi:hypothetical protein V8E36_008054 [Tilletia maclaganii]